ncbi:calpain-like cysteine peptidase [Strigomonas culicis]|uniref:Calpain-like cysteine peptidase n=1 Tax=Strigomonas culicis TaxID=28005 RepID=S9WBN7_9TRYP|nr:calpain-like cysteine peptidase [Strigomonas culicis]|eukprot:EPY33460.1 calpain-like cysteine peptidase [Strigomonas culicis]
MGCGYSTFSAQEDIVWRFGGPPEEPLKAIKMFPKKQNGLLFRLLYDEGERWAFYNDTKEYEFHIRYYFSRESDIEALGHATLSELENGNKLVEIIVYPKGDGGLHGGRARQLHQHGRGNAAQ